MTWILLSIKYIMQLYLNKLFPYLILKSMVVEFTFALTIPKIIVPLAILAAVGTMIPFAEYIEEWWYAPAWMILTVALVYVHDFYMAIRLTGALNGVAWEFRSDKATVWISNLMGALLTVGLLHFLPLAAKAILTSKNLPSSGVDAVYYTLMTVAWGAFILVCLSNIASGVSNAARAGVYPQSVADYIIKRIDTYKPSVFDKEDA